MKMLLTFNVVGMQVEYFSFLAFYLKNPDYVTHHLRFKWNW